MKSVKTKKIKNVHIHYVDPKTGCRSINIINRGTIVTQISDSGTVLMIDIDTEEYEKNLPF